MWKKRRLLCPSSALARPRGRRRGARRAGGEERDATRRRRRRRKRRKRFLFSVASSGGEGFALARGRVSAGDLRGCVFVQGGRAPRAPDRLHRPRGALVGAVHAGRRRGAGEPRPVRGHAPRSPRGLDPHQEHLGAAREAGRDRRARLGRRAHRGGPTARSPSPSATARSSPARRCGRYKTVETTTERRVESDDVVGEIAAFRCVRGTERGPRRRVAGVPWNARCAENIQTLFLLTTRTADWFTARGFAHAGAADTSPLLPPGKENDARDATRSSTSGAKRTRKVQ